MGLRLRLSLIVVVALTTSVMLLGWVVTRFVADPALHSSSIFRFFAFYAGVTVSFVGLVTYLALTLWVVRPIDRLRWRAQSIAKTGDRFEAMLGAPTSFDVQLSDAPEEVQRLGTTLNDMAAALRQERKELEKRVRELETTTAELRSTQENLVQSEKLASIGRLSAGVAHEIGNPLAAILGLLELAQQEDTPENERFDYLRRIHKETDRIHHIIRELLNFSKEHQTTPNDQISDIGLVVRQVLDTLQPQKQNQSIVWTISMPAEPMVVGAHARWVQVIMNLLINAVDAALQGESQPEVAIVGLMERGDVVLRIRDSGCGVDESNRAHVFEPFFTTKPTGKGTGLGLAVSRAIAESMGGTLVLCSDSDISEATPGRLQGACFELRLRSAAPIAKGV